MKHANMTTPVFSDSALSLIHSETKGIPWLINTICTHALYEAKRNGSEVVEDAQIGRILADTERQRHWLIVSTFLLPLAVRYTPSF